MQFAQSLHKAAEIGDTNAQAAVGWMYFKGEGVRQDYTQALKLLRKTAIKVTPERKPRWA
jgi:uncharacterized protein